MVVTKFAGQRGKRSLWEVTCDCERVCQKLGKDMTRSGGIKYCSKQCPFNLERLSLLHGRHRLSEHPIYAVWSSMVDRCTNPKAKVFKNYGGRGILVCEKWRTFDGFFLDMHRGYAPGLTLDRIYNNNGYYPENCRWITMKENQRNRRSNRIIDTPKGKMLITDVLAAFGISHQALEYRLKRGWPADKLFIPTKLGRTVVLSNSLTNPTI